MSILNINTGSSANAGNGDSIRLAFTKVNNNFSDVDSRIIALNLGELPNAVIANTLTTYDLISTGTAVLNNAVITGLVSGTTEFQNIHVLYDSHLNGVEATSLVVSSTATFQDIVVDGTLFGNFSFNTLTVVTTATILEDLNVGRSVSIGDFQLIHSGNIGNDISLVKNNPNGLSFVLRNLYADSYSELYIQDNIGGGLSLLHQDSTNAGGNFNAGNNYIYGVTPTDTINLGAYSDINIFANQANYNTPANTYNSPLVTVSSTNSEVTFNTTVTFTSDVFGIQQGGGFATTSTLVNNGNTLSLGADGTLTFPDSTVQTTAWTGQVVITQSPTAPATTSTSTLWYDTIGGRSYVYFDNSWVDTNPTAFTGTATSLANGGPSITVDSYGSVTAPGNVNAAGFITTGSIVIPNNGQAGSIQSQNGQGNIYFNTDNSLVFIITGTYQTSFNADGTVTFPGYVFPEGTPTTGQVLTAGNNPLYLEWDTPSSGFATTSTLVNGSYTLSLGTDGSLALPNSTTIGDDLVAQYTSSFSAGTNAGNGGTNGWFTSDTGAYPVFANPLVDTITIGWWVSGPGLVGVKQITNIAGEGGTYDYAFTVDLTDGSTWNGGNFGTYTFYTPDYTLVSRGTNLTVNTNSWNFGADGNLTLPTGGEIKTAASTGDVVVEANDGTARTWTFGGDGTLNLPDSVSTGTAIIQTTSPINIQVNSNAQVWTFGTDGNLTVPGNVAIKANVTTNNSTPISSTAGAVVTIWTASVANIIGAQLVVRSLVDYNNYVEMATVNVVKAGDGTTNLIVTGQVGQTAAGHGPYGNTTFASQLDGNGLLLITAQPYGTNDSNFVVSVTEFN